MLFDQGTPVPLRRALTGHDVHTAFEMGWAELENGDLLDKAEAAFDALITTDQNLQYQQNLSSRRLAILVLPTTSWPVIESHTAEVVSAVVSVITITDGTVITVDDGPQRFPFPFPPMP